MPAPKARQPLTITPSTFYVGSVNASCNASALVSATCTISSANPISSETRDLQCPLLPLSSCPAAAAAGVYNMIFATQDTSDSPSHNFTIAFDLCRQLQLTASSLQPLRLFQVPLMQAQQTTAKVGVTANYSGSVNAACGAGALSGQCSVTPGNPVPISAGTTTAFDSYRQCPGRCSAAAH